jgi:hypothetical protein
VITPYGIREPAGILFEEREPVNMYKKHDIQPTPYYAASKVLPEDDTDSEARPSQFPTERPTRPRNTRGMQDSAYSGNE